MDAQRATRILTTAGWQFNLKPTYMKHTLKTTVAIAVVIASLALIGCTTDDVTSHPITTGCTVVGTLVMPGVGTGLGFGVGAGIESMQRDTKQDSQLNTLQTAENTTRAKVNSLEERTGKLENVVFFENEASI